MIGTKKVCPYYVFKNYYKGALDKHIISGVPTNMSLLRWKLFDYNNNGVKKFHNNYQKFKVINSILIINDEINTTNQYLNTIKNHDLNGVNDRLVNFCYNNGLHSFRNLFLELYTKKIYTNMFKYYYSNINKTKYIIEAQKYNDIRFISGNSGDEEFMRYFLKHIHFIDNSIFNTKGITSEITLFRYLNFDPINRDDIENTYYMNLTPLSTSTVIQGYWFNYYLNNKDVDKIYRLIITINDNFYRYTADINNFSSANIDEHEVLLSTLIIFQVLKKEIKRIKNKEIISYYLLAIKRENDDSFEYNKISDNSLIEKNIRDYRRSEYDYKYMRNLISYDVFEEMTLKYTNYNDKFNDYLKLNNKNLDEEIFNNANISRYREELTKYIKF